MKRVFHVPRGAAAVPGEVEREIAFHLEMREREFVERGLAPADAARAARAAFGDVDRIAAECQGVRTRRARQRERTETMQTLWQDLRFAARTLRKAPAYTLVSLLTLALGIGATSAIFSVIDGTLLRPLPYANGPRLVHVQQPANNGSIADAGFSALEVADYQSQLRTLDAVAEYHQMTFTLLGRDEPMRVQTGVVSASYFDLIGVTPLLGRTFRPGEDQVGAAPVLVLSYDFWQRRLGGDPTIVGKTFEMNDRVHTVVGVLPPLPHYPSADDVYMPISSCPFRSSPKMANDRRMRMVAMIGRLAPGIALPQARADLARVSATLHRAYPDAYRVSDGLGIGAASLEHELTADARPTLLVLLATAAFVLLIACANVANLTLARHHRREREIALRAALGAGRGRIARQLLTESVLLALAGGALGLVVARNALGLLVSFAERVSPRAAEITIDWRVLAFAFVVSTLTGLALGLLPALGERANLATRLRDDSTASTSGVSGRRARGALIVAQVAVAFTLLVGAGLMIRSFIKLQQVDPGFDPQHVLTAHVDLNWSKYAKREQVEQFVGTLLDRLRTTPGVVDVAVASSVPLNSGNPFEGDFRVEGRPVIEGQVKPKAEFHVASPRYFAVIGTPIVKGRDFTEQDRDTANAVALINLTAARRYWPSADPIGQRITFDDGKHWLTIVGIVGDTRDVKLQAEPGAEVYVAFASTGWRDVRVAVRSRAEPMALATQLRAAVHEIDPAQPVIEVQSLAQLRHDALASPRLTTMLLGAFAALALVITAAGLAGVVAFSVGQRTREIGIRMALGADRRAVLALIVGQGMRLVILGVVLGVGGAMALSRLLAGLLFEVPSSDPVTFVGVMAVLVGVAAVACVVPARRATRVDPTITMRGI